MTAVGVATIPALKVVGSGKDEVWTFVVKVFGCEFRGIFGRWFWCGIG
jgi:hypothetical protein